MSPFPIVLLYAVLAGLLLAVYLRVGQRIFLTLGLMTSVVSLVYAWIWLGNPPIELAREVSRWLWCFEGGSGLALAVTYLRKRRS